MDDRSTAISAAEVADDGAEIAAAVKVAKAFRDKLEAASADVKKHRNDIIRIVSELPLKNAHFMRKCAAT